MRRDIRLRHTEDFQRLRREGHTFPHRLMVLSIAPNTLAHNRYGVIVSKHLGKAVTRNRVRRRVKEAARLIHPQLQQGYDLVIIARAPLVQQPFSVVQRTVYELFQQAGILEG
jgi:ribonuclease P protein component